MWEKRGEGRGGEGREARDWRMGLKGFGKGNKREGWERGWETEERGERRAGKGRKSGKRKEDELG